MSFTKQDAEWLELVAKFPSLYQIIIDNDSIWVETDDENGETVCVYNFSSYGYDFIYGLLNHLGVNADMC